MNPLRCLSAVVLCALLSGCAGSSYQQGRRALDEGDPDEAIRLLEAARAESPDDARLLRELGVAYYRKGQYEPALANLSRAAELLPRDGRTAFYLGATYEGLTRYDEAIEAYRRYSSVEGGTEKREMEARLRVLKRKQLAEDAREALAQEQSLSGAPGRAAKGTVAVPPFDAATLAETRQGLGRGMAVLVATDLSFVKKLRVLERQRLNVLMDELGMASSPAGSGSAKDTPAVPPRPDADWAPSSQVRGVKERLAYLRRAGGQPYYRGAMNDADDPEYQTAVRDFQQDKGLTVDGRVGPMTLRAIEDAVAARIRETPAPMSPQAPAPVVDRATAPSLGRMLRAGTVVSGSITSLSGESIRVDALTTTPGPGEKESGTVETNGKLEQLFDMEKTVVFALLDTMRVEPTPEERQAILNYRPTKSLDAFLVYCEGLEREARNDYSGAQESFQRAASIDPGFSEASAAAEENGDLAAAEASGWELVPPEMAFAPPAGVEPVDGRLETSLGQAAQSLNPDDPAGTTPRFVGIGNPPPRPGP